MVPRSDPDAEEGEAVRVVRAVGDMAVVDLLGRFGYLRFVRIVDEILEQMIDELGPNGSGSIYEMMF